jgi:hypothetical protein
MTELRIAETWDGKTIAEDEVAVVALAVDGDELVVRVDAPFHGDPPPDREAGPCWGLWEHEAVELFVLGPDACGRPPSYAEIELGPHGHHLVLQLVGVRNIVARELPIRFDAAIAGGRWVGVARIPLALLPVGAPPPGRPLHEAGWTMNATAVHGVGERRYLTWAPLGGPKPDFHQLACFRAV